MPETDIAPRDLEKHNCINLCLPTHGNLLAWEFEKDSQKVNVRVEGQWVFNSTTPRLRTALAGIGLVYLPANMVAEHVEQGRLVKVLEDWYPTYPGYHLYYPRRRQSSPAFPLLLEKLRHRE